MPYFIYILLCNQKTYYVRITDNLGLLYWQQKKYDEAVNSWKKTLKINPDFQFPPEILQLLQTQQ